MALLAHLRRDVDAATSLLVAFSMVVLIPALALCIDAGNIFMHARRLQNVADLAAVSAARNLSSAAAAAQATATANATDMPMNAAVTTGTYVANAAVPIAQRFSAGSAYPNAARVTVTQSVPLIFARFWSPGGAVVIGRSATATQAQMASFSIGTALLQVQGGAANALLSALTGSQVQLSVMSYNALASANINLLSFSQALQTRAGLQGLSFNQVLATSLSTGTVLNAMADVLGANGQSTAALVLGQLAAASGSSTVQLNQLLNLGPYGVQDHVTGGSGAAVQVSALQLLNAALELANGGHQLQLNLGATIPGLANTTAWVAIGTRASTSPWLTIGADNAVTISTAQTRIYVQSQVAPGAGSLSTAGVSLLNVPIYIELASAQAQLSSLNCAATGGASAVQLSVAPSVGTLALGQVNTSLLSNFSMPITPSPATLASVPLLLSIQAQAQVNVGGNDWQSVNFTNADIQAMTSKAVSTGNVAQATVSSLMQNTTVSVNLLGILPLTLGQSALTSNLNTVLSAAATPLDGVLDSLESMLGVQLGAADVWVNGLRCNDAVLVG